MRLPFASLTLMAAAALAAGCASERGAGCARGADYSGARSVSPIRVPDDLSLPDESEALSVPLPPAPLASEDDAEPRCLDEPPSFFENQTGESRDG